MRVENEASVCVAALPACPGRAVQTVDVIGEHSAAVAALLVIDGSTASY